MSSELRLRDRKPFQTKRRFFRRETLYALLFVFIMADIFTFFGLRWLEKAVTFHPERYAPGSTWSLPAGGEDVWFQTADGARLHGWFISSAAQPAAATVIYFHGNGGNLSNVGWIGARLATNGFDVLIFDYRGYGRSEGDVNDEQAINEDAGAAYDYVVRERGAMPEKIALYGQSLGTTAAVDLASRKTCGALILESGLSSASSLASEMLPWMPRWLHKLGRNRFESARKLASVRCPVLVSHGEPDRTIPTGQGRALFDSAPEPKRLIILPGADHNVAGFGGYKYLDTVASFIQDSLSAIKKL